MNYPMNYSGTFARIYHTLLNGIKLYPTNIVCNQNNMLYELLNVTLNIDIQKNGDIPQISIYSNAATRAVPIGFVLAEFLTILTNNQNIKHLAHFNKNILNYVEHNTHTYHYGTRLYHQLPNLLILLTKDKHTRKACANIWYNTELELHKHQSCNVFIQFIIRNDKLNLIVISRSSDLLTGLIIDAIHWQMLLVSFYHKLRSVYADLNIGSVVYKITSLHVYTTDHEIMDNIPNLQYVPEYEHNLPFYKSFNWLRQTAPDVTQCYRINDLIEVYLFDNEQIDVIHQLQSVYKARKFNVIR